MEQGQHSSSIRGVQEKSGSMERDSREMTSAGYNHSFEQCREKIKKLRAEYKKIRDKRTRLDRGGTQNETIMTPWAMYWLTSVPHNPR